jgi:hypothetical protein
MFVADSALLVAGAVWLSSSPDSPAAGPPPPPPLGWWAVWRGWGNPYGSQVGSKINTSNKKYSSIKLEQNS